MQSGESTARLSERWWKHRSEAFGVEGKQKVYSFGDRGGWVHATRGRRTGTACIIARVAFISDPGKTAARTSEHYDTGISYRDCSGKRSIDAVAAWLEGAKLVEPIYNRAR